MGDPVLTPMRANRVFDRGPMTAVRDPALIHPDGVLRCFHTVAEAYAVGPGHFVTSGDVGWVVISLHPWATQLRRSS